MNTRYLPSRYILYTIIVALLLTACAPTTAQRTQTAVIERARFTLEGIRTSDGVAMSAIAGDLYAIAKVTEGANGAYLFYEAEQQIAVCLTEGGKMIGGGRYWFAGIIDVNHTALLDAGRAFRAMGIDIDDVNSLAELKTALQLRGFEQFAPASVPLLAGAVRLGIGFLRTLGGTMSDILTIPAYMLTPEMLNPFCINGDLDCGEPGVN